jgi:hypothetical protein
MIAALQLAILFSSADVRFPERICARRAEDLHPSLSVQ